MTRLSILALGFFLAGPIALAAASETDATRAACNGKSAGDACTNSEPQKDDSGVTMREVAGACQSAECCEQDYSKGSPPEISCEACVTCKSGATPTAAAPNGGASGEPPRAGDDPPASAGNSRGCQAGGTPSTAGMLALGLLGLLRRRPR